MPTEHRIGDLFAQPDLDPATSALAQGVNCIGVMGAGIAPVFKRIFGEDMFEDYRTSCRSGALTVGGLHVWRSPDATLPWLYNLASQHDKGRDARLDAIESSLTAAIDHAEESGVSSGVWISAIALPRVGAGIGGLAWPDVKDIYDRLGSRTDVRLISVSLPNAGD